MSMTEQKAEEQAQDMSDEELKACANALVDELSKLFDGKPIVAISAALFAFLETSDGDITRGISTLYMRKVLDRRARAECDCATCTARRAAKRGQA